MRRVWNRFEYTTRLAQDNVAGWIAIELYQRHDGGEVLAGRVVYWDAEGQYAIEVKVDELPLIIVEELIAEARQRIGQA